MKPFLGWSLGLAALLCACGGDTFTTVGTGGGSVGTGGSHGAGGSPGTGGYKATGGTKATGGSAGGGGSAACDPMPGCTPTSSTTCSDGCNTCSCSDGQWGCTARACPPPVDAAVDAAPTFLCETDAGCIYRPEAGCCGMCLAVSDPVPPMIPCGRMCFAYNTCACVAGKCAGGTLVIGTTCAVDHDLCGGGTRCCKTCGAASIDGSTCTSAPVCKMPDANGGCPPVP